MSGYYLVNGQLWAYNPYVGTYAPIYPQPQTYTPDSAPADQAEQMYPRPSAHLNFPELCFQPQGTIESVHSIMLNGSLRFVPYPRMEEVCNPVTSYAPLNCVSLFIGHLPFAIPDCIVIWAIELLLQRNIPKKLNRIKHKPTCGYIRIIYKKDEEELLQYNHGLMFDLNGVWIVSDDPVKRQSDIQLLRNYSLAITSGCIQSDARLPKGPLVIEKSNYSQ